MSSIFFTASDFPSSVSVPRRDDEAKLERVEITTWFSDEVLVASAAPNPDTTLQRANRQGSLKGDNWDLLQVRVASPTNNILDMLDRILRILRVRGRMERTDNVKFVYFIYLFL